MFGDVTILIATVVSIYALSLCFVAVLLVRALWHDRSKPMTPVVTAVPTPAKTASHVPLAEMGPATKSA